jgi:hypothetical protein
MNKAASPSLEHRVTAAQVVCKKLRTVKDPDAYFDTAQHEFSVALRTMSLDLLDSLDRRLNALGEKVARLEATTRKVVISRDARAGAQEIAANFAAQQERAEKSLLSLWLQGYVRRLPRLTANANDHEEDVDLLLDAVDFAFCRCALNVAISSSSVSQEKLMSSRVVSILISMVDGANKAMQQTRNKSNDQSISNSVSRLSVSFGIEGNTINMFLCSGYFRCCSVGDWPMPDGIGTSRS